MRGRGVLPITGQLALVTGVRREGVRGDRMLQLGGTHGLLLWKAGVAIALSLLGGGGSRWLGGGGRVAGVGGGGGRRKV